MVIAIQPDGSGSGSATTLADSSNPGIGAPSELKMAQESQFQASRPIQAPARKLYNRGNAGGRLSFRVRPRFETPAAATEAVVALSSRRGLSGSLKITPGGTFGNAQVARAVAEQIGVTVQVEYEIEFGA